MSEEKHRSTHRFSENTFGCIYVTFCTHHRLLHRITMASLTKSTTVHQRDPHTYTIDFDPAWTIGTGTSTGELEFYIVEASLTDRSTTRRLCHCGLSARSQPALRHHARQTKSASHHHLTPRLPAPHTGRPGDIRRQGRQARPSDFRRARHAAPR